MIEKKVALVKILDRCNGSRKMLENVLSEHPGLQIDNKLAKEIIDGMEKAEIYRRVTNGVGKAKNHCSSHYPKHDGEVRRS